MKKTLNTTAAILALMITFSSAFGKTKMMSSAAFNLTFKKIDVSLVGTWERNAGMDGKIAYCQFNANGTYIAFEKKGTQYTVTGRGKWMVEKGKICVFHGEEKSTPVTYKEENNQLMFGDGVGYSKPSALYANK